MRHILYPAPVTFDLLNFQWSTMEDEVLLRTKLLISTFNSNITAYGIVDSVDPSTAFSGGVRPFSVSVDGTIPTTINIVGGTAVFKNGEIIVVDSNVLTQINLTSTAANARNIVYLKFGEEQKDIVITRFLTPTYSKVDYYTNPKNYVHVLLEADYNNLSSTEKDLTIPLALVTVQVVSITVNQLTVDMSRTDFTTNRPWFSVVDSQHRSYLGTGVQTVTNTHALSFNDISVTDEQTFFQVLLDHGMIVAKDQSLAGVPGKLCSEVVSSTSIYTDDTSGTITGISNSYYFILSRFPRIVARCTNNDTKIKDYAPAHIPGKNLVFLVPNDEYQDPSLSRKAVLTSASGTYTSAINGTILNVTIDSTTIFSVTFSAISSVTDVITQINNAAATAGLTTIVTNASGQLRLTSPVSPTSTIRSQIALSGSAITATPNIGMRTGTTVATLCSIGGTFIGLDTKTLNLIINSTPVAVIFDTSTGIDNVVKQINDASVAAGFTAGTKIAYNNCGQLQLKSNIVGISSLINIVSGTALSILGLSTGEYRVGAVGDSGDLEVTYSAVEACEPPTALVNTTFPINQPASLETIVAGGVVLQSLSTTDLTFESAGQIPSEYRVYIDSTGVAKRYPQTVFCLEKLSTMGFAAADPGTQMIGVGKLRIGLTGAGTYPNPSLSIKIQLTGTDSVGAIISEILKFGSVWEDSSVPYIPPGSPPILSYENSKQWVTTENVFYSITSVLVVERVGDASTSAITVQALIDPITTPELADILPVAYIAWDGLKISNLWDIRPINTLLKPTSTALTISSGGKALAESSALLWDREASNTNYVMNFWNEDFEHPGFVSTEVTDTTSSSGLLPTSTSVQKVSEGLGPNDVYISKPVAIIPHLSNPHALRFIPIEPGITFSMSVRYYTITNGWSNWVPFSSLVYPLYTLDLSTVAAGDVIKWQMYVSGEVKGMSVVYLTNTISYNTGEFIWDSGAWGEGTLQ